MKTATMAATKFLLLIFSFLSPVLLLAQDGGAKVDISVHKESSSTWYTNPVVWIIGAAVFILLLVALLRGGNNSSKS